MPYLLKIGGKCFINISTITQILILIYRYFKWYRLAAIYAVVKNLLYSSSKDRRAHNTLALGAIMVWLLNGLYHRQRDDFEALAREACQHVPIDYADYDNDLDDEDEDFAPLMYNAGLYFVSDIVNDRSGTYRIPFHKTFSEEAFVAAFKLSTIRIREIISAGDHPRQCPNANMERTSNRSTRHTINVNDIRPSDRPLPRIAANLDNIPLQPPQVMQGEDVDHFNIHGGGNRDQDSNIEEDEEEGLTQRVQNILEQFYLDLIEESPNKKRLADGAWTSIPKEMRHEEATEKLFMSFGLPFFAAQYMFCSPEQWKTHFNRLFPCERPKTLGQNYGKSTYYMKWLDLIANLSPDSFKKVHGVVKAKFDTLLWVPCTQSDRIWCTRSTKTSGWYMLPKDTPSSGPQIAFNPKAQRLGVYKPFLYAPPTPTTDGDNASAFGWKDNQQSTAHHPSTLQQMQSRNASQPSTSRVVNQQNYNIPVQAIREEEEEDEE